MVGGYRRSSTPSCFRFLSLGSILRDSGSLASKNESVRIESRERFWITSALYFWAIDGERVRVNSSGPMRPRPSLLRVHERDSECMANRASLLEVCLQPFIAPPFFLGDKTRSVSLARVGSDGGETFREISLVILVYLFFSNLSSPTVRLAKYREHRETSWQGNSFRRGVDKDSRVCLTLCQRSRILRTDSDTNYKYN